MGLSNLDNLVKTRQLKHEPFNSPEFIGLVRSGQARLKDAYNTNLALESRFDLAYNAAHSLALAALRRCGYRSTNRYLVFQVLTETLGLEPQEWRILSTCHDRRNLSEYEGYLEIDKQLVTELLTITQKMSNRLNEQESKSPSVK